MTYSHCKEKTFANDAEDIARRKNVKRSYNESYIDNTSDFEEGLKYKQTSSSTFFNALFNQIDSDINFDGVIAVYDTLLSYKEGSVFLLNGSPVQAVIDIDPGKADSQNCSSLNEKNGCVNWLPQIPFWSTKALQDYFFMGDGLHKVIENSSDIINAKYIFDQRENIIKDYIGLDDYSIQTNDFYHVHIYDERFLTDPKDEIGVFSFNFHKKLIFLNTSGRNHVQILKNFFKCFPTDSFIKVCRGVDDGHNTFQSQSELAIDFNNRFFLINQKIEITQIDSDKFVVEYCLGESALIATNTYLDIHNKKIIRLLDENRTISTLFIGNPIEKKENSDIISLEDHQGVEVLDLMKESRTPFACLYLEKVSYILFSTDNATMTVVKYNAITTKMHLIGKGISVDSRFVRNGYVPRILRNYGQFGNDNKHMLLVNESTTDIFGEDYSACYFIIHGEGDSETVSFSAIDKNNQDTVDLLKKVYCHCQYFDKKTNNLYMFKMYGKTVDISLTRIYNGIGFTTFSAFGYASFIIKKRIFNTVSNSFSEEAESTINQNYGNMIFNVSNHQAIGNRSYFSNRYMHCRAHDASDYLFDASKILISFMDRKNIAMIQFDLNDGNYCFRKISSVDTTWFYGDYVAPYGLYPQPYDNVGVFSFLNISSSFSFTNFFSPYSYILTSSSLYGSNKKIINYNKNVYSTNQTEHAGDIQKIIPLWRM